MFADPLEAALDFPRDLGTGQTDEHGREVGHQELEPETTLQQCLGPAPTPALNEQAADQQRLDADHAQGTDDRPAIQYPERRRTIHHGAPGGRSDSRSRQRLSSAQSNT